MGDERFADADWLRVRVSLREPFAEYFDASQMRRNDLLVKVKLLECTVVPG